MAIKNLLCLLLFFTCITVQAQNGSSITGTVTDEKGEPLPGATVFINNSKYSQATTGEGKFSFANLRSGRYEVVVKMIGFKPAVQSVELNGSPVNIPIRLAESSTELNTVTINGRPDPNRSKYLAWFIKQFIGQTVNSQQCKLLNPDVLRFRLDKATNVLTATAQELLVVENKALGYNLKYLLNLFQLNLTENSGYYNGYPYFEDMPGDAAQKQQWERNRRDAYLSSDRHFFKAVMDNKIADEGFIVFQITDDPDLIRSMNKFTYRIELEGKLVAIKLPDAKVLFKQADVNLKELTATRRIVGNDTTSRMGLFIAYTGMEQPSLFHRTGNPIRNLSPKGQVSRMHIYTDKIFIDDNGSLAPAEGSQYSGFWAWQRIADLTPFNYFGVPDE